MTTVIRLEGYTAPERDTGTWTGVRIERAPGYAGPWPGTVLRADPVAYLDPKTPPTLNFQFADPDGPAWYRAVWTAPAGEEAPTHPVQGGEWSPDWPSVGEVALVLRARLVELGGHRVETFTSETRPTAEEVAALIGLYAPLTLTGFGDLSTLGCGGASTLRGAARALIASRVATEIEYSFRPEEVGESAAVAAAERRAQHDADVTRLQAAVDRCREEGSTSDPGAGGDGTSTGRSDPAWLFNRPPILNW